MGSRNLYLQIDTDKTPEQIKEAMKTAFRTLGGAMHDRPTGLEIRQGTNGVSFGFAADLTASVDLRQVKENRYEIECQLNWKLNGLSIACLVIGIFVFGILWIVPLLYLFFNPESAYQQALHRVQTYLA
ncbi:MAG TPA: hypothetical protein PKW05_11665 [Anaerolineae bacterium]|nr:hypothetical protein [Anaerolineae bacterium]HQJ52421.1 hypothetical protein [Anaerolineae bacterium]